MSQIPIVQGIPIPTPQPMMGTQQQQQQQQQPSPQRKFWFGRRQQQQPPPAQVHQAYPAPQQPFVMQNAANPSEFHVDPQFNGKGQVQPKQYQDVAFAIAFVVHLIIMFIIMAMHTPVGGGNNKDGGMMIFGGVSYLVTVCAIFAGVVSTFALGFMFQFATALVKAALIFSVACSLLMGIFGVMGGEMWVAMLGFLSFAVGCCYAYMVWGRIPFAAANLKTALTAVRANLGLAVIAYLFMFLAFGWSVWWSVSAGVAVQRGGVVIFLYLLSYYWVHQVLQNTVHVTSAGVIGTWWFIPDEASSYCSPAIMDSFCRATTFSFGSICFGSFLVALIQALRALHQMARENDDCSFLVCLIDCILGCIQGIIEYINKWAYVYVGLYGYSYVDAGRNVMTLFQQRGWTTIITDDLADNVLFMISVAIGLMTGLVGLMITKMDPNIFGGGGGGDGALGDGLMGFLVSFLVGFLFASILMSVVGSAVNTVIVLFAESPREFQQNHPQLSEEMRASWRQAWPTECGRL